MPNRPDAIVQFLVNNYEKYISKHGPVLSKFTGPFLAEKRTWGGAAAEIRLPLLPDE
jgi:hypothetical protein